ncbi:MAG: type II secretion system F family protein [Actinomycetota bacterium]|nr:type II secretion system F family protein [Actinomycetota bacterium]
MTELIVAGLCSITVWLAFREFLYRDQAVAARVRALAPALAQQAPTRPVGRVLVWLGERLPVRDAAGVEAALKAAGRPESHLAALRGTQILGLVAGAVLGLLGGSAAILLSPALALGGFRLPILTLRGRARRARYEVEGSIPDTIDLLAVCTQAGLNLTLALTRVAGRAPGILGGELRRAIEEMDLGVPRTEALARLARRLEAPDLGALVNVLQTSDRLGTQVSAALENLSHEVRARRRRRAEEQARRAPVKILFPLVFLILPAFILLTVVPLLMNTFSSLSL